MTSKGKKTGAGKRTARKKTSTKPSGASANKRKVPKIESPPDWAKATSYVPRSLR